jgi:hypothetical protein
MKNFFKKTDTILFRFFYFLVIMNIYAKSPHFFPRRAFPSKSPPISREKRILTEKTTNALENSPPWEGRRGGAAARVISIAKSPHFFSAPRYPQKIKKILKKGVFRL